MEDHPIVQTITKQIQQLRKHAAANSTYVRTGDVRRVARSINRMAAEVPVDERLNLIEYLYQNSDWHCHLCATHILAESVDEIEPRRLPRIAVFVSSFDTWGKVDDFATSVLHKLLLKDAEAVLPMVRQWNRSSSMWERRLSMVAFTRKAGASGRFTAECLALAENLLYDPEDLVQKAVGWALKDTMRGDHETVLSYIKNLRQRGVSSVITLYAIRDLKGKEREDVLALKPEIRVRKNND
jgi:3-methyladenine DNA glycosylase AlkD